MIFFRTPFFLPWLYPQLTWRIPTVSKELYLTFDDGPVPGPTEFVLAELGKSKIPATFFCIGDNVRKHPEIFRKIKSAGHAVGNHTFHHISGWKARSQEYKLDVDRCDEIMTQTTPGRPPDFFRPPYGRITRDQIRLLSNFKIVMWDVLTHDYAASIPTSGCLNGSIGAARPGSIVVFHDSLKAEKNMSYVLPRFIDHFGGLGYSFKALS